MKKSVYFIATITLGVVGAFCLMASSRVVNNSSLLLQNVEALSKDEGTSAGYCARRSSASIGEYQKRMYCNSKTDANTIYPCPSESEYDYYAENNTDRCTKDK